MNASLLYHTDGARYRPLAGFTPRSLHRARRFFSRACGGRRRLRLPATGASSGRGAGLTRRGLSATSPPPGAPPRARQGLSGAAVLQLQSIPSSANDRVSCPATTIWSCTRTSASITASATFGY